MLKRLLPRHCHFLTSSAGYSTPLAVNIDSINQLNQEKKNIEINGWIKSVQKKGQLVFVKLEDGRFNDVVQIVINKELAQNVQVGSPIKAIGIWRQSQGNQQKMELEVEKLEVFGADSNPRYDVSLDNLRKKVHLRTRSSQFSGILKARSRIFKATHDFFMDRDFVHIDTPKLTKNDCEGGGEVFDVITPGEEGKEKTYLSVSSQLHLEAMASRLSQVYTLGVAFRAEKQQSHAHLSEFSMLEAEIAFVNNIDEMCDLVEEYVKQMIRLTYEDEKLKKDLEQIGSFRNTEDRLGKNIYETSKWPRIEYEKAIDILKTKGQKVSETSGLSKQNELFLVDHFNGSPIFIINYPINQKPFYMARKDEKVTKSFDLLCPIVGELAGGSVRENNSEELRKRGCDIDWYLELRQRGQPQTAGFGIGFERLLQLLLSIRNIKDTVAFPRWYKHCQC